MCSLRGFASVDWASAAKYQVASKNKLVNKLHSLTEFHCKLHTQNYMLYLDPFRYLSENYTS